MMGVLRADIHHDVADLLVAVKITARTPAGTDRTDWGWRSDRRDRQGC